MTLDATRLSLQGKKAYRIARNQGVAALGRRAARYAISNLPKPESAGLPLASGDIADSRTIKPWELPESVPSGHPLSVGWVCAPPGPASGGHTTMFRYVRALEEAGHRPVVFLYDPLFGGIEPSRRIIRQWWPDVRAEVRDVRDGMRGLDAVVATSWQSAHVVATRPQIAGHRFYLVQDYEPLFYGRGPEHVLAEDSYRFGFHCLTVGGMLSELLHSGHEATCTPLEFGCDRAVYSLSNTSRRSGVAFYTRPETERRGHSLGVMALELFHEGHPDIPIHTYGTRVTLPFPAQHHAQLSPAALAALYNTCAAGLALSFTNVSLVPFELLSCGAVPVVNDDPYSRPVLKHPGVRWARPTPVALAEALSAVAAGDSPDPSSLARDLGDLSWKESTQALVHVVEETCWSRP